MELDKKYVIMVVLELFFILFNLFLGLQGRQQLFIFVIFKEMFGLIFESLFIFLVILFVFLVILKHITILFFTIVSMHPLFILSIIFIILITLFYLYFSFPLQIYQHPPTCILLFILLKTQPFLLHYLPFLNQI